MKTLIAVLSLLVAGFGSAVEIPLGSPPFVMNYKDGLKTAKKDRKPVVLMFSAYWCGPSTQMLKQVLPSETIKPYHGKFVWVYLDTDSDGNDEVATQYGVSGIPHFEFVSSSGRSLGNLVGSVTADEFAKTLDGALKKAGK